MNLLIGAVPLSRCISAWTRYRVVIAGILLTMTLPVQASALGELAAQMSPGQWRKLSTGGDASGISSELLSGNPGSILGYVDKGKWDAFLRRAYFIGQGHYSQQKFIQYDEETNRWSEIAKPYWDRSPGKIGHGYQHNSIDSATGDFYFRLYNTVEFYRLDRKSGQWSQLPAPSLTFAGIAGGVEYYPEIGGLVFVSAKNVATFTNGRWNVLYNGTLPMAQYHNVAVYSKQHGVVYLGGGNDSRDLYKLTANQAITRLPDPPTAVGVNTTITTVDPVSGNLLVFTANAAYQYSAMGNVWSRMTLTDSPITTAAYTVAIPVDNYGVIMFVRDVGSKSDVWLYKHSPSASTPVDSVPPVAPSGLRVN